MPSDLSVALQHFGASYEYKSNELAATRLTELLYHHITDNFASDPFFGHDPPIFSRSLRAQQGIASEYGEGARGRPCGHVFSKDETVFRCRNCGMDDTCVLCQRCFRASDHEGHDVSMSINAGSGGCCDCGDPEAWRTDINCSYHSGERSPSTQHDQDNVQQLEPVCRASLRRSLAAMLDFVLDVLYHARDSVRAPILDDDSDPRLDATAARLTGEHYEGTYDVSEEDAWSCVLWNDEKHNFDEVIDIVKRACKKNRAFGQNIANTVDRRGRATVYTGNLKEAVRIATMLGRIRLGVTVRSARDAFREDMIETIIAFLHDLANMHMTIAGVRSHGTLRTLICEVLTGDWQRGVSTDNNPEAPSAFYDSEDSDEQDIDMIDPTDNADMAQTLVQAILGDNNAIDLDEQVNDDDDVNDTGLTATIRRFSRRVNVPQITTEHDAVCPPHWRETPRIPATSKRSRLAQLMLRDLRLWKQARLGLRELYITTMVALPQFKSVMGTCFAQNYKELAEIYFFADREPEHSMIIFSVQLFTVPSITSMLVRDHHFFSNLLAVLYTYFTTQKPGTPQDVDVNTPVLSEVYTFRWKRHYHAINDLKYILNTKLVQDHIPQDPHILRQFIDWLQLFQGMDAQRQMLGSHIEYESDNWISAFNLMLQLARQVHAFGESYRGSEARTQAAVMLTETITHWGNGGLRERMPLFEPRGDIKQELMQPGIRYLSFHHPLNWLLASVMSSFESHQELAIIPPEVLAETVVFSVRTIIWTWEIRCRQWVRNGQSIVAQMWHYTEPSMREFCIDKDVRLVQIMMAHDAELGFQQLSRTADVILSFGYGGEDPRMIQMQHHRVLFYIALLQERAWMTDLPHREVMARELRHALAFGGKSYSDLVKLVSDRYAEEPSFEDALASVAEFKAPTGLDDTGTYVLRRGEFDKVDPYFHHYSRSQTEECLDILRKRFGGEWSYVPHLDDIGASPWSGLSEFAFVHPLSLEIASYFNTTMELPDGAMQAREALTDAVLHLCLLILTEGKVAKLRGQEVLQFVFVPLVTSSSKLFKPHAPKLKLIHALTNELFATDRPQSQSNDATTDEDAEFARKKALAKARQARLMNEMQASQSAFLQNQAPGDTTDEEEVDEEVEDGRYRFPSGNCMVCQRPLSVDHSKSMYGILATIQDSRLDRRTPNLADHPGILQDILEHPPTMDRDSDWLPEHQPNFPTQHAAQRDSITTCGHTIHWHCFESFSNSFKNELVRLSNLGRNVPLRMEFQCPLCQTVGNVFVPIYCKDKQTRSLIRLDHVERPLSVGDFPFAIDEEQVPTGAVTADMGLEHAINLYIANRGDLRTGRTALFERDAGMLTASIVDAEVALRDRSHNHSRVIEPLCLVEGLTEQSVLALRTFAEAIRRRASMALAAATSPPVALVGPLDTPGGQTATYLTGYLGNMKSTYEHRLAQLFDPLADPKTRALLYEDTFAVLVELLLCRPESAEVSDLLDTVYEAEIVKVVLISRQSIGLAESVPTDPRDVDEFGRWCEATFYQSYKEDDLAVLVTLTQRYALAFLRKVAILLHVVCMIDYPVEGDDVGTELDRLTTLLNVRSLGEIYASPQHTPRQALVRDWLRKMYVRHINNGDTHVYLSHPLPFTMAHLPRELDRLLDDCLHRKCPGCNTVPSQPAICLLCGALVCFQTQCCHNAQTGQGECTTHRQSCSGSIGIYLIPKRASLLLLRHESGAFVPPPYLDVHGETDPDLKRGKPQFLSRKRYDVGVRQLYLKHGVATLLARKYESMPDVGGFTTL